MFKGGAVLQPLAPFVFNSQFPMFSKISDVYENMESARISIDESPSECSRIHRKSFDEVSRTTKSADGQLEHRLL